MYERYRGSNNLCWGANRIHPGTVIHWHEFYEVEYIVSGSAKMSVNGVEYDYGAGYLTFVSPNDFHHVESTDGKKLILSVCDIRAEALPDEIKKLLAEYKPPYILKCDKDSQIVRLLNDFDDAYVRLEDKVLAKYTAHLLISHLIREVIDGKNLIKHTESIVNDAQLKSIKMILQYIDKHYKEKLTRDEIAEKFNYSPGYLSKFFKKATGEGLFEHIIDVRMKKARELVLGTKKPIGEIIYEVGYHSPSLFYKHYYEHYKSMPYELKKERI